MVITARHTELYDTEANWVSVDPVLSAGEIAVSKDKNKIKIGDGEKWCAMDGNYSAKNVFLTIAISLTTDLGVQKLNGAATKSLPSTGVNIEDVLEMFTSKEENPTVTKPKATVKIAGSSTGAIEDKAISYEAGTTVVSKMMQYRELLIR